MGAPGYTALHLFLTKYVKSSYTALQKTRGLEIADLVVVHDSIILKEHAAGSDRRALTHQLLAGQARLVGQGSLPSGHLLAHN